MEPSFFYAYLCISMYLFRKNDPERPSNINIKIMRSIQLLLSCLPQVFYGNLLTGFF